MSKRARRLWLLISFFAVGALAPLLMRPSKAERDRLEANYNQIAGMTRTERLRLQRNFDEFQAMSPTEQARFRDLHTQLEADKQSNGVHVEVMDVYYDWLGTLRGDQREELRKEPDPQVRRERAEVIIDEQQAPPPEFGDGRWPKLSSQQLDSVFAVIEANIPFTPEQQQQLDALAPAEPSTSENPGPSSQQASVLQLRRHLLYLQFLIERLRAPDNQAFSFLPHVFQRLLEFGVLQESLDAIGDERLKEQILEDQWVPGYFAGIVWGSVFAELQEYRRNNAPTDARLNELFNSLPAAQQDDLLSLGAQDFQHQLTDEYQKLQLQELNLSDDIRQLYQPWGRWGWGRGGRPGGGFGGGGGPGNNPPGDGRGGGRGPGPFGNGPDRGQGGDNRGDNDDRGDDNSGDEDDRGDDSEGRDRRDDNERRDDE